MSDATPAKKPRRKKEAPVATPVAVEAPAKKPRKARVPRPAHPLPARIKAPEPVAAAWPFPTGTPPVEGQQEPLATPVVEDVVATPIAEEPVISAQVSSKKWWQFWK